MEGLKAGSVGKGVDLERTEGMNIIKIYTKPPKNNFRSLKSHFFFCLSLWGETFFFAKRIDLKKKPFILITCLCIHFFNVYSGDINNPLKA